MTRDREIGILLPNNQRQHRTSRRMCCLTHCASYCAPCQPLVRAFSGWIRSPPPTMDGSRSLAGKTKTSTCVLHQSGVLAGGGGGDARVVVEARDAQSSAARPLAAMAQGGSQSAGVHSLAGMTKTSTCALHETDREGCCHTSTCLLQLTVREGFCWGVSSGLEGRTELHRKRDESLDTVLVLSVLARRGLGGIWRNHDTALML